MPARSNGAAGSTGAEHLGQGARLTVAGAAARLGVAASTLRTWERRYGLGPSARTSGKHRRYNANDVARLEKMRTLTREGVAPADAARLACGQSLVGVAEPVAQEEASAGPAPDPLSLAAAAVEGDFTRLQRMLAAALAESAPLAVFQTLVMAALDLLRSKKHVAAVGHAPHHTLASMFLGALAALAYPEPESGSIVLSPADGFLLQAHVVGAELAMKGHHATVVTPQVDFLRDHARSLDDANLPGPRVLAVCGPPKNWEEIIAATLPGGFDPFVICLTDDRAAVSSHPSARTLAGAVHELHALLQG